MSVEFWDSFIGPVVELSCEITEFHLRSIIEAQIIVMGFYRFNHTPVIMASGRELCYVLLSGVCMCYAMTFVILARPTVITCALLRVGLGEDLNFLLDPLNRGPRLESSESDRSSPFSIVTLYSYFMNILQVSA